MEIHIPITQRVSLKITEDSYHSRDYPTARLKKGIVLVSDGQELAEEGVDFGVPILKQGLRTVFPGDVKLVAREMETVDEISALFTLNLEERITRLGKSSVGNKQLYILKNYLAMLIRTYPSLRNTLMAISDGLRTGFKLETTYQDAGLHAQVKMIYIVDSEANLVTIDVDTTELVDKGITEIIVMNEQGARAFDKYHDSDGITLRGGEIGCWDEVTAEEASFISDGHHLAFTLGQVGDTMLYRGRELVGSRLAWSGFGYSFSPEIQRFSCALRIEHLR